MLQYVGTKLHTERACIFEPQGEELLHGSYEWFAEGLEPCGSELLNLPCKGLLDGTFEEFKRQNCLVLSSCEQ